MTNNLNDLGSQIKQELTEYQKYVSERLTQMLEQGLISPIEKEKIMREAILTGQEILTTLQNPASQSQELTEMYIYALFENYKHSVESKLNPQPSFNPFDFLFKDVSFFLNKLGVNLNNTPKPKGKKRRQPKTNPREISPQRLAENEDEEDIWEE
jgi:hypothetical protein